MESHSKNSDPAATTSSVHASNVVHEYLEVGNTPRAIDQGFTADADISSFLNRKVKIASFKWQVGQSFAELLAPWELFLSNPAISNKLQNYYLFKGDLMLTFMINGTPFHAGILLASYLYQNQFNEFSIPGGDSQIITRSQRPHLYLNASTCKGGHMCVPMMIPSNYLAFNNPQVRAVNMGFLNIDSITPLTQINSGTDDVTLSVFAQMQNVKLTCPTPTAVALSSIANIDHFFLEAHAQDEYEEEGVVSGPASRVALIAGSLKDAPIIGSLAMATEMGALGVSGIARFFGYSRPGDLGIISGMRNTPVSNLALTESSDMSQKLSLTGKQEITVDPATVGLPPIDELSLKYLCTKESYLLNFGWNPNHNQDDVIFAMEASPMTELRISQSNGGFRIVPTALSYVSRAFEAWSGSLIIRFQVIASQYHRGRIGIFYNPSGAVGTSDLFNTTFNTILDLADSRDVSVCVKYQQPMGYSFCQIINDFHIFSLSGSTANTLVPDALSANGALVVKVINELTVPDGTSPVRIAVSIRAGDDFELINPTGEGNEASQFAPVAVSGADHNMWFPEAHADPSATEVTPEEENAPEGKLNEIEIIPDTVHVIDEKPCIYYGERISSIRTLIKRFCHWRSEAPNFPNDLGSTIVRAQYLYHAFPSGGGFDPDGPDFADNSVTYAYNSTTFLRYFSLMYTGWRGSVRWKVLPSSPAIETSVIRGESDVIRAKKYGFFRSGNISPDLFNAGNRIPFQGVRMNRASKAGAVRTQNRTMDSIEFEIPYALPFRYSVVRKAVGNEDSNTRDRGYPGGNTFYLQSTFDTTDVAYDMFCAAGEDFTFFGFKGAPSFFLYNTPLPES